MTVPEAKFHSYLDYRERVAPVPEVLTAQQKQWLLARFRRELLDLDAGSVQVSINGLPQIADYAVQLVRVQQTAIVAFWLTNLAAKDVKAGTAHLRAVSVFLTGLDDAADIASLDDARRLSIDGTSLPVPLSFWRMAADRPKPMMATWFIAHPARVAHLWDSALALGEAFFGALGLLSDPDEKRPTPAAVGAPFRVHIWSAEPVKIRPVNPLDVVENQWLAHLFCQSMEKIAKGSHEQHQLIFRDRHGKDRFSVLIWSFGFDAMRVIWLHDFQHISEKAMSGSMVAQSVLLRGTDPGNDLRAIAAARGMRNPSGEPFPAPPEQWEKIKSLPRPCVATLFPGNAANHAIEWHASLILARAFFRPQER